MIAEKSTVSPAVAQLRGDFVGLLAQIEDEEVLREMLRLCREALREVDMLEDLPPAVLAALEAAIEESYDESDLISNDVVTQMARKWTKQ
jgi:hypothetical protein